MANLTVIVPTIGRHTLVGCLDSFADDLDPNDQVVVIADGHDDFTKKLVANFAETYAEVDWLYLAPDKQGGWGHGLRNHVLDEYVENEWVWSIDDDDEARVGGIYAIKDHLKGLTESDPKWFLFRIHFGAGHRANGITLWHFKYVQVGNVGTPMIVAPASALSRWGTDYFGDYGYAEALQQELGDPEWCNETVAVIKP